MKVHVLHENPEWYPPLAAAFDAAGVEHEQWLLGEGALDLDADPPPGVFWSRMSASSYTRDHVFAKDHTRAVLAWLEAAGRRVVNGRRVLELEMSKVDQLIALNAAGFDVPRTFAVVGDADLRPAAEKLSGPFIVKPNQGGKGHGVRRYDSVDELSDVETSPDGITLVQEYVRPAEPFITRVEIVNGEFVYAIAADTARGGFELCPADACAVDDKPLFALRQDFEHPIVGRYLDFAAAHGIEIAAFEFIETADGRLVTYDINTNTNFNPAVEAVAPRSGPAMIARFLRDLLEGSFKTPTQRRRAAVRGSPPATAAGLAGRRPARAAGTPTTLPNQPQTANPERHAGPPERSAPPTDQPHRTPPSP